MRTRSAPITAVEVRVDDGDRVPMVPVPLEVALWQARREGLAASVRVRTRDDQGRHDEDVVEPPRLNWNPPERAADGSDRDRVGAWPEKGILGTQLGPNRNGHKW